MAVLHSHYPYLTWQLYIITMLNKSALHSHHPLHGSFTFSASSTWQLFIITILNMAALHSHHPPHGIFTLSLSSPYGSFTFSPSSHGSFTLSLSSARLTPLVTSHHVPYIMTIATNSTINPNGRH